MVDTPRTTAYLKSSIFQDGQPTGSITPQDMRDLVESVAPSIAGADDPTNTSGLGAPAIIRGTVYGHKASGVTMGTAPNQAARIATRVGLQAAIDYAFANKKFFELVQGNYQIEGAALDIPYYYYGFDWHGWGSNIQQFSTNVPGITIGDASNIGYGVYVEGLSVTYGASQTGQTSANAIQIGGQAYGRFQVLYAGIGGGGGTGYPPYVGIKIVGSSTFFSNRLSDVNVEQAQKSLLSVNNLSTGNLWERCHLTMTGGTPLSIIGPAVEFDGGGSAGNGTIIENMNIEWCKCNVLLSLNGMRGVTFNNLHIEGYAMTGSYPMVVKMIDSGATFNNLDILDLQILTAQGVTDWPRVFWQYYGDPLNLNGFMMQWVNAGELDQQFQLFNPNSAYGLDYPSAITATGLRFADFGGNSLHTRMFWDPNFSTIAALPIANQTTVDRYVYRPFFSEVEGVHLWLTGAYSYYGQIKHAYIGYPASITSCTLMLKNTMRPTSPGATVPRMVGDTVFISRGGGTMAGTLTIARDDGTTLITNTTAGYITAYFNGTNWAIVT